MGHVIYLLVPLFMANTMFADANSLARIGVYQSNRLLPLAQTTDAFDTIHFNIASYSWVDARLYNAKQSNIYGNMTTEDWSNLDLSLESNPKAKEAIEWLLAKYIWDDACNISASDIDALISKFAAANPRGSNGANFSNSITLQCPKDTTIGLLTEKLVTAGIIRKSTKIVSGRDADMLWVYTPEAVASNGAAYEHYYYRKYGKNDNWVNGDLEAVAPETKIKKGEYITWMTPNKR